MRDGNLKNETPLDPHELDLLVDGELNERRRRELLASLDERQGGWRQCALAFLEDQCLRQTCTTLEEESIGRTAKSSPAAAPSQGGEKQYKRPPGAVARAAGVLLAMAASFLIALGLGSMFWNAGQQGHMNAPGGTQRADIFTGSHDATPADPSGGALVHDAKVFLPGKYQTVTITDQRPDGSRRSIQLPAIEQNNIDETRLRETPSAIPPELVKAFHQAGHNVHQSRRLVPFRMKDGRRLVVPVDQLDVRYVSNPEYQ